jgi:hypothetical protein
MRAPVPSWEIEPSYYINMPIRLRKALFTWESFDSWLFVENTVEIIEILWFQEMFSPIILLVY